MKLRCASCGKSVSSEVPDFTITLAFIECPECIEKEPDFELLLAEAVELLKESYEYAMGKYCFSCHQTIWRDKNSRDGHEPDCKLKLFLEKVEGK